MHNAAYNEKSVIYREVTLLLNSNATKRKNICNFILKNWDLRKEITFWKKELTGALWWKTSKILMQLSKRLKDCLALFVDIRNSIYKIQSFIFW